MLSFCDSRHKIYNIFEELAVANAVSRVVALISGVVAKQHADSEDSGRIKDRAFA